MRPDAYGRYLIRMSIHNVKKSNGDLHRQCSVTIPVAYSAAYPDGQRFYITKSVDGRLVLVPEELDKPC